MATVQNGIKTLRQISTGGVGARTLQMTDDRQKDLQ